MTFWMALIGAAVLWGIIAAGRSQYARRRRERALSKPFPDEWETILERSVALYRRLPDPCKIELRKRILLFLDEKRFEGCGGLTLTDEIRLTVAAQACLLVMNRPTRSALYPRLSSILVYPEVYMAPEWIPLDGELYMETTGVQSGESWQEGMVVIAWKDAKRESKSTKGPYNVVIHEFAHQLDQESGWADGTPILRNRRQYERWQTISRREFSRLREEGGGSDSPLNDYGGLDPAEFFAVATETFFQDSRRMADGIPELYDQLKDYYGLDPAEWNKPQGGNGRG
ncbi:MAG: zinc-dependent peptidase [Syntrophales bacterium]|jgi:Mlc titration factor MtfA (ptsG expression regulator)|nr:zinc-dependent peptidase [Syntrophales bacterium]MCK9528295.1 zinc-dependent peptidase [Syntrophales bacterium]MDX9922134.1 zinc-dependent peptidase [Syntrophales bacterium]